MGRTSLGVRHQCNVRLSPDLIARIDAARGRTSRDTWFAEAAELALRPASQMVAPALLQKIHQCAFTIPVTTRYEKDDIVRVKACECGETKETKEWRE